MSPSSPPRKPLIICSRLPGEGYYHSLHFETRPVLCSDDFDYWRGLSDVWESDRTLINVEHDVDVRERHLSELIACPHGLCSWAYRMHWASNGVGDLIAAGTGDRDRVTNPDPGFLQGGEEWAAWSAIGLVKIAPEARIGPLRREPWATLELAVHDAVNGRWHMHWPEVPHWHY